jgi:membrane-bound lytic murein transglycosylase D
VPIGTGGGHRRQARWRGSLYRNSSSTRSRRGETLTSIAKKYKVSAAKLRELNELSAKAKVQARQELRIPSPISDALPAVAARPGVAAGRPATGSAARTYQVRSGDTLFSIARQFATTVAELKRLNGLTNDSIRPGDRLTVRR